MAEMEADDYDGSAICAVSGSGILRCGNCSKIYRRDAAKRKQEEVCRGELVDKSVLSRAAAMALSMLHDHDMGVYTSTDSHTVLSNVILGEATYSTV